MVCNSVFSSARQFDNYKRQQYSKIYQHEADHKAAAGSLAGPIVIEKDENGVATGGHVDIKMPQQDYYDPDKTIDEAQTAIDAALAPEEPSDQDYKVADAAENILIQAESSKDECAACGQKLDVVA